jgi:hypothetical protein
VGYQTKVTSDSFAETNTQYLRDQVAKKAEYYRTKLLQDAEELGKCGVNYLHLFHTEMNCNFKLII